MIKEETGVRDWKLSCEGLKVEFKAMYYRARSEQKPRSPKPPPAAAAKYAPQPPHWVPPGPTGVGGELVSRPGEGVLSARSHRNLFTVELSCESASGQDRANGSVAIARKECAKIRQIREIGKSPVWTNLHLPRFFLAKLSRKKGFCAHIFYYCII